MCCANISAALRSISLQENPKNTHCMFTTTFEVPIVGCDFKKKIKSYTIIQAVNLSLYLDSDWHSGFRVGARLRFRLRTLDVEVH